MSVRQSSRRYVILGFLILLMGAWAGVTGTAYAVSDLASTSHLNPATWYSDSSPAFAWSSSSDPGTCAVGYSWALDSNPSATPDTSLDTLAFGWSSKPYTTGNAPHSVAVGDFNGDLLPDLVTANTHDNTVSIFLNSGTGTFAAGATYDTGGSPQSAYAVAVGDFNADGSTDLVVANKENGNVGVLMNKGDGTGTFNAAQLVPAGDDPVSVAVADFDHNGALDIAVANQYYGMAAKRVTVLLNNGSGGFSNPAYYPTGNFPTGVAAGDLNGDGSPDLVVSNSNDNTVSVFININNGSGTFGTKGDYPVGVGPSSVAVADLNGDGKPDVVTTNSGGFTVSALLNFGNGTFGGRVDSVTCNNPGATGVADFNGDGKLDLAVAGATAIDNLSVLEGNGDGTFASRTHYGVGDTPTSVAVGDFNSDGKPDFATANFSLGTTMMVVTNASSTITSYLGQPDGEWYFHISALDSLGNWGPTSTVRVRIDTTKPEVTSAGISDNASYAQGAVVSATPIAQDATSGVAYTTMLARRGDSTQTLVGPPFGIPTLAAGDYTLTTMATDLAGNTSLPLVVHYQVSPSPVTQLAVSAAPSTVQTGNACYVTVTAEDAGGNTAPWYTGTVHFTSSGPNVPALPQDYTFTAADNGTQTFRIDTGLTTVGSQSITATDTATGTIAGTVTVTVIPGGAYALILQHPTDSPSGNPFTVTVRAQDRYFNLVPGFTGQVHFLSSDGSSVLPADYTFTAADGGSHTFTNGVTLFTVGSQTVSVYDTSSPLQAQATVVVGPPPDSTPPTTTAALSGTAGNNGWYTGPVTVTLSAQDDMGGTGVAHTYYTVDGGPQQTGISLTVSANDTHSVAYWSVDNAGNEELPHKIISFKIDTVAPTAPTLTGGGGAWFTTSPQTVSASGASDATSGIARYEYTTDAGAHWTTGTSATVSTQGTTTVAFRAVDNAGNAGAQASTNVRIDTVAPTAPTLSGGGAAWFKISPQTVSASGASDATSGIAGYQYKVGSGNWTNGSSVSVSTQGTTTVAFRAVDNAGNLGAQASTTVKIDTTAPTVNITNGEFYEGQSYPKNEKLSIDFTATDGTSGTSIANWSVSVKRPDNTILTPTLTAVGTNGATTGVVAGFTDAVGTYQATITATDAAGRTTSVVVNYLVVGSDWGNGLLALATGIPTPNDNPPTINVTTNPIVPLRFTINGTVRSSSNGSKVISGLNPRLYVVRVSDNKLVYKASTYFQLAKDGYYKYDFDTRNILSYIPTGPNGALFRHIVVFCDPAGAPKFTCGCGCGAGSTTTTDLTVAGANTVTELAPVTSDAGVLKVAAASASAAAGSPILAAAASTPSITSANGPYLLTTAGIANVSLTGTNFSTASASNYVQVKCVDNTTSAALTATTKSTSAYKMTVVSWATGKVVFTSPALWVGTMNAQVYVGTAYSTAKTFTTSPGSASGTIRYIRGG